MHFSLTREALLPTNNFWMLFRRQTTGLSCHFHELRIDESCIVCRTIATVAANSIIFEDLDGNLQNFGESFILQSAASQPLPFSILPLCSLAIKDTDTRLAINVKP